MTNPTITFPDNATIWATGDAAITELTTFLLEQGTAFSAANYDGYWAFNVMPGTWQKAHADRHLQPYTNPGPRKVWVCKHCGSADLLLDAMVGLNDDSDVSTYDSTYCRNCESEGDSLAIQVTVPAGFDTHTDIYKEPGHAEG